MTLLDIWVLDAPILRQDTTVVTEVTDAHRRLIDDMFETMYAARGIGLAAHAGGAHRAHLRGRCRQGEIRARESGDRRERRRADGRGGLPLDPRDLRRRHARAARGRARTRSRREADRGRCDGSARALPAARDRSSARAALHRLSESGEAAGRDRRSGGSCAARTSRSRARSSRATRRSITTATRSCSADRVLGHVELRRPCPARAARRGLRCRGRGDAARPRGGALALDARAVAGEGSRAR